VKLSEMLSGIYTAAVTPLTESGEFLEAPFAQLLERTYSAGTHGVYVCGSTGEGLLQGVGQRKLVTEAAVRNSPRGKHVIVHVGASNTADAIALARHAARTGAAAVSSLPPMTGSYSFEEIKRYYTQLAEASPLPVILYYFPQIAPAIHSVDQLKELCAIEGVAGIKFTDYDLFTMAQVKQMGVTVFYGRDEMLAAGLWFGADGAIGTLYNVVPGAAVEMYHLARQGHWEQMKPIQAQLNELIRITTRYPLFPAVKELLRWSGINCGACLPPRRDYLSKDEIVSLQREIEGAGLDRFLSLSVRTR
jgi:N-acetylneuraminate lyase